MSFYPNSEQFYSVIAELFKRVEEEYPDATQEVLDARLAIRFRLSNPNAEIYIDGKKNPLKISYGSNSPRPDLDVGLPADYIHNILLGELTLKKAMASGKLKVKGPFWKLFVLEDLFHKGQSIYPHVLEEYEVA